jgi:hypothetical protein
VASDRDNSWTIRPVTRADFGELLPLVRGYSDFYEVAPSDIHLQTLVTAPADDPVNEGVQLLAWDNDGPAVGFATVYWSWSTAQAAPDNHRAQRVYDRVGATREQWIDYFLVVPERGP